jgi:predicted  nucleic acid-binding Zn-ribbon protein
VEGINEKEIEANNLKRQLHTQKNRIASLEQEVNNLSNIKENYEIFVLKATEQIKNSIKEAYTFIDDMENQKMVMESRYRQLNEKTVLIQNQLLEIEGQKNSA